MKINKKFLGIVGGTAMLVAAGSAFTASTSVTKSAQTVGYGTQTISGGTAEEVNYSLNPTGDTITAVSIKLTGDTTDSTVKIAFGTDNLGSACTEGSYDNVGDVTPYTCSSLSQSVSTANALHISVVGPAV